MRVLCDNVCTRLRVDANECEWKRVAELSVSMVCGSVAGGCDGVNSMR